MAEDDKPERDVDASEVPTFARAILIARQHEAIPYLDMRIAQLVGAGEDNDAALWSAVKTDAKRQIDAGEWKPGS